MKRVTLLVVSTVAISRAAVEPIVNEPHRFIGLALSALLTIFEFPSSALAQSGFEGARYSYVKKYDNGDWTTAFYRVEGKTIKEMTQLHVAAGNLTTPVNTSTYQITNDRFFMPMPPEQCMSGWVTDSCGRQGIIKVNGIYLSFVVNGRPLAQPGGLLIAPVIPRQN
jgi:hypothetical protein